MCQEVGQGGAGRGRGHGLARRGWGLRGGGSSAQWGTHLQEARFSSSAGPGGLLDLLCPVLGEPRIYAPCVHVWEAGAGRLLPSPRHRLPYLVKTPF